MRAYSLTHLGDGELVRGLAALVTRDCRTTAEILAHIAEVDARRLYAPAGYSSMFEYCVQELRFSEQSALKRIRVARTARQYQAIFPAVADGRLNLSTVLLLTSHLRRDNAEELIAAASRKSRSEVEVLLAERFPRPDLSAMLRPVSNTAARANSDNALSPGTVGTRKSLSCMTPVAVQATPARVKPLASERFALQVTVGKDTRDKIQHARNLLGHKVPSGDLEQVLDLALDALIEKLEKRKFAATDRPQKRPRAARNARTIPARVKRAVWERDGGRCTFVNESGKRCSSRSMLEFDHVEPVARGGRASVNGIRLRCRVHNQYEAEQAFGAGFMHDKREHARREQERRDLRQALKNLGFRAHECRQAVELANASPGVSLEDRVRVALSCLMPRAHVQRCVARSSHCATPS